MSADQRLATIRSVQVACTQCKPVGPQDPALACAASHLHHLVRLGGHKQGPGRGIHLAIRAVAAGTRKGVENRCAQRRAAVEGSFGVL